MKYKILALIASCFLAINAIAQDVCVSYLAAQGFSKKQCTEALKVFDRVKHPCMEFLWKSFNTGGTCPQRFLNKFYGKPHTLQIEFSNEAGRRNGRLASYEFAPGLSVHDFNSGVDRKSARVLKAIKRNTLEIADFVESYANKNSTIILSTGLEDNYTEKTFKTILNELKKTIPSALTLRNPVGTNEKNFDGADYIELHGLRTNFSEASRNKCIRNLDGTDINFSNTRKSGNYIHISDLSNYIRKARKSNCQTYIWWGEVQGIGAKFVEPRARNFRVISKHILLINKTIRANQ